MTNEIVQAGAALTRPPPPLSDVRMVDADDLAQRLAALPPAQFNLILHKLAVAPGVLSSEAAPQLQRAVELLRYMGQGGDQQVLLSILEDLSPSLRIRASRKKRIFLCHKAGSQLDSSLAQDFARMLSGEHEVFLDERTSTGIRWASDVEQAVVRSDFIVVLMSSDFMASELLEGLLARAAAHAEDNNDRPKILPIRVRFQGPLIYPLSIFLRNRRAVSWESSDDTETVVREILTAVADAGEFAGASELRQVSAPISRPFACAQIESPEGTMGSDSALYVSRPADDIALRAIRRRGATITIKGPRQVGKSSLLVRLIAAAREVGKRVVFIDFQQIEKSAIRDEDRLFRHFLGAITRKLAVADRLDEYWRLPLSTLQRATFYLEEHIIPSMPQPIVLALDEVDSLFDAPFRSDFFGMLRSWHNARATDETWRRLDIAQITSTEPYQFITDLNQSPFNVGEVIEPEDFTRAHVEDLNGRHGDLFAAAELDRLTDLLGGHPYLVRRAFYLVATQQTTPSKLFLDAVKDRGPFDDHLRRHLLRLHDNERLAGGLMQVLRTGACDQDTYFRLRGVGLVRREGGAIVSRCVLYGEYFRAYLRG